MDRDAEHDHTQRDEAATEPVAEPTPPPAAAPSYRVVGEIGRGGMGEVMLARDPNIGRDVALKRLRGIPGPAAIARFVREAKVQARLDHPAIVPVYELGRDAAGQPYFTMKRLTGTTLRAVLDTGGRTMHQMLRAVVEVSLAIELAHSRGVVHRDLKPSNIMLGDFGEVYVLDWGVARVLDEADEPPGSLDIPAPAETDAGQLLGTPGYMSPEQILNQDVGPPADVYALGTIVFEILAGEPLHPSGRAALAATLTPGAGVSPAERRPERAIAPELDAACTAALAEDPAGRPTARQLGERIQRYLDGDRDLDQRRALATTELTCARAALDADDRAEAIRRASRAVALDPASADAVQLFASLIVEPPSRLPRELARDLAVEETRWARDRSRRAIVPFLCFFLVTPVLPFLHVSSWPQLIALYGAVSTMIVVSYINWRVREVPLAVYLMVQLAVAVLFSRLTSPFVLAPGLTAGMLLALTAVPWLNDRAWAVALWALAAATLPFVLEYAGLFAATFHWTPNGLLLEGSIFQTRTVVDTATLAVSTVAITVAVALYSLSIARDRRQAQRHLFVQAWHLHQLLPRAHHPA